MRRLIHAYLVVLFVFYAPLVNAQPAPCDRTDGKGIVACVAAAYPERLDVTVDLNTRIANMQFLRDRIIETARCKGLDVGLNLKRGGPAVSNDFIAWRHDGITEGIDIGRSYDAPGNKLKLTWGTYQPPHYGYPTYKAYGPVSCAIEPPPVVPPPPAPAPDWEALKAQIGALSEALNILRTELAALRSQFANVEVAIPVVESRVFKLEQIPVPVGYKCSGRIAFGIPIRCTVTAEVNP